MRSRPFTLLAVPTVVLAALAVWPLATPGEAQAPKKGGVLRVGMIGEPPTLDGHTTTAVITPRDRRQHLRGAVRARRQVPAGAAAGRGPRVLDGGKRYVIRLRKDVKFHNGKALTSADVVASLKRWGAVAGTGKSDLQGGGGGRGQGPERDRDPAQGAVREPPHGAGPVDNAPFIYPKEVIDATGDTQLKEFVGTGAASGSSSTSRTVT